MRAGIVAEYNPFHNGHLYQIAETGKYDPELVMASCSYVIHMEKGQIKENYPLDVNGAKKVLNFFRI